MSSIRESDGTTGPGAPCEDRPAPAGMERAAFTALSLTILTSPLGSNFHVPGHPSIFAFRVFLVAFVVLAGLDALCRKAFRRPSPIIGPEALIAALACWGLVSILWADSRGAAFRYVLFLIQNTALIYGIVVYGRTSRKLAALVASAFGGYLIVVAGALFERETGYRFPESMFRDPALNIRFLFSSFFHNSNDLATFFALWVPMFIVASVEGRRVLVSLPSLALGVLSAFLVVLSLSRANTMAVVLAVLVIFGFTVRRRALRWAVIGGLCALLAVFMPAMPRYFASQALTKLAADVKDGAAVRDTRARLAEESLVLLKQSRWLGVGAGNVEARLLDMRVRTNTQTTEILNVHNWWLEVLVNLGVVGFAIYLLFYAWIVSALSRRHVRLRAQEPSLAALSLGLLASVVGFAIGCLSSSSVLTFAPIWVQFGFCAGVLRLGASNPESSRREVARAVASGDRSPRAHGEQRDGEPSGTVGP